MSRAPQRPAACSLAVLLILACPALSGCRAVAEIWNCPGMHALWLDESTVHCLP